MPKSDPNAVRVRFDRSAFATGLSAAALVMSPALTDGVTGRPAAVAIMKNSLGSAPSSLVSRRDGQSASVGAVLQFRSDADQWEEAEKKRFHDLAVEEAVGTLTPDEEAEFGQLTLLRRTFQHPRSGDEILWEFEQRRRTSELLETLRKYVEFYDGANSAWFATGQDPD